MSIMSKNNQALSIRLTIRNVSNLIHVRLTELIVSDCKDYCMDAINRIKAFEVFVQRRLFNLWRISE